MDDQNGLEVVLGSHIPPVEMFPESECTKTDSPNVFIHKPTYEGCGYRVWFQVGVQYFRIGDIDYDDLEHAHWHAKMFIKALTRLLTPS